MIERRYLVDNNALSMIGQKRRSSSFFRGNCRVTEDVVYEARFTVKASTLSGLVEPVTPAVLQKVIEIMKTVPVGDATLVNLYDNKGAADPTLVATALVLTEQQPTNALWEEEWIIVTNDKAVRAKAKEFSVVTITPAELSKVIDAA